MSPRRAAWFALQPLTVTSGEEIHRDWVMCGQDDLETAFKSGVLKACEERLDLAETEKIPWLVQDKDTTPLAGYRKRRFQND